MDKPITQAGVNDAMRKTGSRKNTKNPPKNIEILKTGRKFIARVSVNANPEPEF
jgi:hypothetical protein